MAFSHNHLVSASGPEFARSDLHQLESELRIRMSITAARLVPSVYVKKIESREWSTHDISMS